MLLYALYVTTMETRNHEMLQQIRLAIGSPFRRRFTPCSKTNTARTVAGTDMKRLAARKIYETPENKENTKARMLKVSERIAKGITASGFSFNVVELLILFPPQ